LSFECEPANYRNMAGIVPHAPPNDAAESISILGLANSRTFVRVQN
jgi:hypothetical protein